MQVLKEFDYTPNMKTIIKGKFSELKSYYCREDFELALADYDHAPEDAKCFRLRDVSQLCNAVSQLCNASGIDDTSGSGDPPGALSQLCNARGIDVKALIADRSILESIPTRSAMQDELLQYFYDIYAQASSPSDFMKKIVYRLAPEYSSDTVRVAILKKFVVGAGDNFKRFHTNQIWEWAKKQLDKSEAEIYQKSTEEKKKVLLLNKIDDSIFEHSSVEITYVDVLKLIIDRIGKYQDDDTLAFEKIDLSENTIAILSEIISEDEGAVREDVIKRFKILCDRIVNGLIEKDEERISEFVASLENDFRNQLKTIKRVSKTGKEGTAADLYKQAKKDYIKAKKALPKRMT